MFPFNTKGSLKYEIIFHNFVCRSFPTPAKYAGAPAPAHSSKFLL
jgi:hypothetical protein